MIIQRFVKSVPVCPERGFGVHRSPICSYHSSWVEEHLADVAPASIAPGWSERLSQGRCNTMLSRVSLIISIIAAALSLSAGFAVAADEIVVSAGAKGSPQHRVGRIICTLLNRNAVNINCSVLKMPEGDADPSFANLVNVRDGAVELGVARSDWQHFAVTGTGPVQYLFSKFDTIRSLFAIDTSPLTLLAARTSGVTQLDDLKGRRVNVGRPRTVNRTSMDILMAAKSWTTRDFALAEELTPAEQSFWLCHGKVDAISYVVSHPNEMVERTTRLCDAALVEIGGPDIDKLLTEHPYLSVTTIPGGMYASSPDPVKSFGTTITLVSSSDVSDELVYNIVKTVFENLPQLHKRIAALQHLSQSQMLKAGITAPLHPGALKYYQEQGLN